MELKFRNANCLHGWLKNHVRPSGPNASMCEWLYTMSPETVPISRCEHNKDALIFAII